MSTIPTIPEWMTVVEVAAMLRVHPQTIRDWLDAGHLAGTRFGGKGSGSGRGGVWRIRRVDVDALAQKRNGQGA